MGNGNNLPSLQGYVTSRSFGGLYIPVPMQSSYLRGYCVQNDYLYKLHVNENEFPHSYLVLESVLEDIAAYDGIVCCSAFMLPENPSRRARIYQRLLDAGAGIHFVLDGNAIQSEDDVAVVETNLALSAALQRSPTPDEMRQALGLQTTTKAVTG